MARSDLIIHMVKAWASNDRAVFKQAVEAIIAEERSKNHHTFADQLSDILKSVSPTSPAAPIIKDSRVASLLWETVPTYPLSKLILTPDVNRTCQELIEEQKQTERLRSYNLEPRHRILLIGPPGNGKTSLAGALADALEVPFFVVRYEGLIGRYLGETASHLQKVFEYVQAQRCVLFFDEFDAVGKERGDENDVGEIKRLVSSLLLQIDRLPSHVVIVTATNHPELLDRAAWRRFQLRLTMDMPTEKQVEEWIIRFMESNSHPEFRLTPSDLAAKLTGMNFAEIQEFFLDAQRRHVLQLPNSNFDEVIQERLNVLAQHSRPTNTKEVSEDGQSHVCPHHRQPA